MGDRVSISFQKQKNVRRTNREEDTSRRVPGALPSLGRH